VFQQQLGADNAAGQEQHSDYDDGALHDLFS
jgi:hypothetical protein